MGDAGSGRGCACDGVRNAGADGGGDSCLAIAVKDGTDDRLGPMLLRGGVIDARTA